jgi:hypothetical protein
MKDDSDTVAPLRDSDAEGTAVDPPKATKCELHEGTPSEEIDEGLCYLGRSLKWQPMAAAFQY